MASISPLELFRQSIAWDTRYDLPLCPNLNNPWIYGAYALKLMRENGLSAYDDVRLVERFCDFAGLCRIEPGLFNRWPENSAPSFSVSHDELMGMAYISTDLAREILAYLEKTDGVYVNNPQDKIDFPEWEYRFNVYRMVWFKPFLRIRAGESLNLFSQLPFAGHLFMDAWKMTRDKGLADAGGRLRIWIMLQAMASFSLTGAATVIWREQMNAVGLSPKDMLRIEPKEYPIYFSLGKDIF